MSNYANEQNHVIRLISNFAIEGTPVSFEQCHYGHINSTYIVATDSGNQYILQKINTNVFKKPDELMENVVAVTTFLKNKLISLGKDPSRRTLNIIPTKNGQNYLNMDGGCYRVYDYVKDTVSYQSVERPELFYNSAYAFGEFQKLLSDYPADTLHETIPNFHNTVSRLADFKAACDNNIAVRKQSIPDEIAFIMEREEQCSYIVNRIADGRIPLRVTHNDTKLNNVLMDKNTGEGICVIDLDTVMPGSMLYDFGDSIRFGASSAAEDEKDLDKVFVRTELFETYVDGFLKGSGGAFCEEEFRSMTMGAYVITLETGMRFLGDYLNGDTYFSVHYDGQNLDRARTQLKLVADMEKKMTILNEIVEKYANA